MKLAEALILRADCKKRIEQLRERLARSATVQEGDTPPENPQELLEEVARLVAEFTELAQKINRTNSVTAFEEGRTLTDVLAERDGILLERSLYAGLIESATGKVVARGPRGYIVSDAKYLRTVNVTDLQRRIDALSRRYRELDARIQAMNWNVDIIE